MRPAAELLILESDALRPIVRGLSAEQFDLPTVCSGWSVRDVLAHCAAALSMTVSGDLHDFTPEENEIDVVERRTWPIGGVLDELFTGYLGAAKAIDRSGGPLDGIGVGEWMHGGDVREPVGAPDPYTSAGIELAFELLIERSERLLRPAIAINVDGTRGHFGENGPVVGTLDTDLETFVRLCGGRRPDPRRYVLIGVDPGDLAVFS